MDRDELEARIRARRSGQPYRRGSPASPSPEAAEPWQPEPAYADEPSPGSYAPPTASDAERGRDEDDTRRWAPPGAQTQPPAVSGYRSDPGRSADAAAPTRYVDPAYAEPEPVGAPRYAEPIDPDQQALSAPHRDIESTDVRYQLPSEAYARRRPRRAPGAAFFVLGLFVLGAFALVGGALLASALGQPDDTAVGDGATATPVAVTLAPTEVPSPTLTPGAGQTATANPEVTATPRFFFEDGFTASAEPCLVQPTQPSCPAPGDVVPANGTVFILVTFQQIRGGDLIGVHGVTPDGDNLGDASWQAPGGPNSPAANGHAYFGYNVTGFPEGEYEITVTRNGEDAAVTTFRIEG